MALGVLEVSGVGIVEGTPGAALMQRPQDASLVLEACFSAPAQGPLLYPANLTGCLHRHAHLTWLLRTTV